MKVKMFYSKEDIRNIVSKSEMDSVEIEDISVSDKDVMMKVGDSEWHKYNPTELAEKMFPNSNEIVAEFSDGGIFVERNESING